jgi:hypothetical protein
MLSNFKNLSERKPSPKTGMPIRVTLPHEAVAKKHPTHRALTFPKVFRWQPPDGQTQTPAMVEIAGSFTHWQKVPLTRANEFDGWQVTVEHIPGNRTHHYMLLVDGKPTHDENADGMAVPRGPEEAQFQLMTSRGGRVFMLAAQTK